MLQLMDNVQLAPTVEVQIYSIVGHMHTKEAPSCSLSDAQPVLLS